ncbi:DUF6531 domain-containing protein, partial [Snodgrassella sp. ESL0324]|uniref:DUF6531 domain-containing protein n=1 Tax=Snodgrassella sp. ESL0324 TaxID=2705033 RepID=UPI0019343B8E
MGEAYWAAREGDVLLHTSLLADIASAAVEILCYAAIGAACIAVTAGAIALAGGATIAGAVTAGAAAVTGGAGVAVCIIGEIVSAAVTFELESYISEAADWVGSLFPPSEDGEIVTGSHNTHTNSKLSARAAGIIDKTKTVQAPQQPEGFIDIAGNILQGLGTAASEFIRPTVASPDPQAVPREEDRISCKKHPSSFSDMGIPDSLGLVAMGSPGLAAMGLGFSVVSAAIGTITGAAEYLAEGSKKVYINGQPAVRSNDRSTCEAKVTDDCKDGEKVSNNVRIGGESVVVQEIKSGKHPIAQIATIATLVLAPGKFGRKIAEFSDCFLQAIAINIGVAKALGPSTDKPVHLPTGAKLLFGPEDLDFSLPAHLPFEWQRFYSSTDTRTHN